MDGFFFFLFRQFFFFCSNVGFATCLSRKLPPITTVNDGCFVGMEICLSEMFCVFFLLLLGSKAMRGNYGSNLWVGNNCAWGAIEV